MSKRDYKAAYGWLALGSVLVIALGAALFYHHSANQSERTPAQVNIPRIGVAVVCANAYGFPNLEPHPRHIRPADDAAALLNGRLAQSDISVLSRSGGEFETKKIAAPFRVSSPAIGVTRTTTEAGERIDVSMCVTVSAE